jgi:hypothetical protein
VSVPAGNFDHSRLNTLGAVGIAFIFAIIFLSFVRTLYIYKEYYPNFSNKYASTKTRNEDYFSIKGDEPLPSERELLWLNSIDDWVYQ